MVYFFLILTNIIFVSQQLLWIFIGFDDLPPRLDWSVFDMRVNSGSRGAKILQKCIGGNLDGGIGPKTLALMEGQYAKYVVNKFAELGEDFYEGLSTFKTFGKGWTRRTNEKKEQSS